MEVYGSLGTLHLPAPNHLTAIKTPISQPIGLLMQLLPQPKG
jgi:hypothetical protein